MSLSLPLPARLDVDASCDLWSRLAKAEGHVVLDFSALNHVSAAALQVLLVAHRKLHAAGGSLTLADASAECISSLSRSGAADLTQAEGAFG